MGGAALWRREVGGQHGAPLPAAGCQQGTLPRTAASYASARAGASRTAASRARFRVRFLDARFRSATAACSASASSIRRPVPSLPPTTSSAFFTLGASATTPPPCPDSGPSAACASTSGSSAACPACPASAACAACAASAASPACPACAARGGRTHASRLETARCSSSSRARTASSGSAQSSTPGRAHAPPPDSRLASPHVCASPSPPSHLAQPPGRRSRLSGPLLSETALAGQRSGAGHSDIAPTLVARFRAAAARAAAAFMARGGPERLRVGRGVPSALGAVPPRDVFSLDSWSSA